MKNKWFIIVNPTSGNGASKKKWPVIKKELLNQNFKIEVVFTAYEKHSIKLLEIALKKGFTNFICVGGDGTLHNIINGILRFNPANILEIKIGIIPIGTGNDWVKTYNIPLNYKKAIDIIKTENTIKQDIGKININSTNETVYFNNMAGIGFDGYVVNNVHKYKKLGFLAYLVGALISLINYKKSFLKITFNKTVLKGKCLMLLIGICNYAGGGMQLTKKPNSTDGLFDITYIKNLTLLTVLNNIRGLFNGKITSHKLINTYKTSTIKINVVDSNKSYIQADGELIGSGDFIVSILPKAINFIIP
ncbi:diacylglycerol/lipid kinase family protein [Lutibacter sp.]